MGRVTAVDDYVATLEVAWDAVVRTVNSGVVPVIGTLCCAGADTDCGRRLGFVLESPHGPLLVNVDDRPLAFARSLGGEPATGATQLRREFQQFGLPEVLDLVLWPPVDDPEIHVPAAFFCREHQYRHLEDRGTLRDRVAESVTSGEAFSFLL